MNATLDCKNKYPKTWSGGRAIAESEKKGADRTHKKVSSERNDVKKPIYKGRWEAWEPRTIKCKGVWGQEKTKKKPQKESKLVSGFYARVCRKRRGDLSPQKRTAVTQEREGSIKKPLWSGNVLFIKKRGTRNHEIEKNS